MKHLGILGVGHLASYLVPGWARGKDRPSFLLSPRNAAVAARLERDYGCHVASDNAALVRESDVVVLATRPGHAVAAVRGLPWRAQQTVVSVVAGLEIAVLAPAVAPAQLVRSMPITSAAVAESPTLLYPEDAVARALFEPLGPVLVLPDEAAFTSASVIAALYGWVYALIGEAASWSEASGLAPDLARRLVAQTFKGAAAMTLERPEEPLSEIVAGLATPGSITKLGLDHLEQAEVLRQWRTACDLVLQRLENDHAKAE